MARLRHRAPAHNRPEAQQAEAPSAPDTSASMPLSAPVGACGNIGAGPDTAPTPGLASPASRPEAQNADALPEPVAPESVALSAWQICGLSVTGLAHQRKGLPCQDAVAWRNTERPILALSDGAGSAAISERGAGELVRGMSRFLMSMEDALCTWLDEASDNSAKQAELWSRRLLAHAQGLLADLAQLERRSVRDVRATLLLAVLGTTHVFWWQVGDGAIVTRSASGLQVLGSTGKAKGEFANQTCFVDTASMDDVQFGLLPTADIQGLALMSDGGAERLVAHDGSRVASRMGSWFDELAQQSLSPDRIALAYHEPAMWERTTLDDRSIVLAARMPHASPCGNHQGICPQDRLV